MNTSSLKTRISHLTLGVTCLLAAMTFAAVAPANAVTPSPVIGPSPSAQLPVDVPPSAPSSFSTVTLFETKPYTLLSWTGANAGTSVGPLEYHWKLVSVDPTCSGAMENAMSYQAVTMRSDALVPIGNNTLVGCQYTVGVQTMGVGQYGTYMTSPWAYTTYRIQPTWKYSPITASAPITIVNKFSVSPNYRSSGLVRLTWSYPTQPANISGVFVRWYVNESSGGAADPNRHTMGGDLGSSVMLNLIHGNTYTITLYTEGVVTNGTTVQPAIPSGRQDIAITFTA